MVSADGEEHAGPHNVRTCMQAYMQASVCTPRGPSCPQPVRKASELKHGRSESRSYPSHPHRSQASGCMPRGPSCPQPVRNTSGPKKGDPRNNNREYSDSNRPHIPQGSTCTPPGLFCPQPVRKTSERLKSSRQVQLQSGALSRFLTRHISGKNILKWRLKPGCLARRLYGRSNCTRCMGWYILFLDQTADTLHCYSGTR